MPIHEFRCAACGNVAEILVRESEGKTPLACPVCGSRQIKKLISAPNVLKGTKAGSPRCGQATTCCGNSTPCESPPCSS